MSIKSRTIDNLGMETSVRYATDKEQLDVRFLEESKWIPKRLEVSVTKPYVPSEFDQLFSSERLTQWASFVIPPKYELQSLALFSHQLIPSLGGYEKLEADTEKLAALKDVLSKDKRKKKRHQQDQEASDEDKEEEEERQTLLALFQCIETLDRTLTFINSRRNQYQRG